MKKISVITSVLSFVFTVSATCVQAAMPTSQSSRPSSSRPTSSRPTSSVTTTTRSSSNSSYDSSRRPSHSSSHRPSQSSGKSGYTHYGHDDRPSHGSHYVRPSSIKPQRPTVVHHTTINYVKPTPKVTAIRVLPSHYSVVRRSGINYYYSAGRYYRYNTNGYICVVPPVGLRVRTLPVGYTVHREFTKPYYYYAGTYYKQSGSSYEVVSAPADVVVYTLPEETERITIGEKEYYIYGGNVYSVVYTPDGKAFKMTGSLDNL